MSSVDGPKLNAQQRQDLAYLAGQPTNDIKDSINKYDGLTTSQYHDTIGQYEDALIGLHQFADAHQNSMTAQDWQTLKEKEIAAFEIGENLGLSADENNNDISMASYQLLNQVQDNTRGSSGGDVGARSDSSGGDVSSSNQQPKNLADALKQQNIMPSSQVVSDTLNDAWNLNNNSPGSGNYQAALTSYWKNYNGLSANERQEVAGDLQSLQLQVPMTTDGDIASQGLVSAPSLKDALVQQNLHPSTSGVSDLLNEEWNLDHSTVGSSQYNTALDRANKIYDRLSDNERNEWAGIATKLGLSGPITGAEAHPLMNSRQGRGGDCWFLASIQDVGSTAMGQQYLNSLVTADGDGKWTVKFPGDPNNSYTVTQRDLDQMQQYDTGNTIDNVLQAASQQYYQKQGKSIYDGGYTQNGVNLLTGKNAQYRVDESDDGSLYNSEAVSDKFDKELRALPPGKSTNFSVQLFDSSGKPAGFHALTILGYDPANDEVTYANPWDQSKHFTAKVHDFTRHVADVGFGYSGRLVGIDTV